MHLKSLTLKGFKSFAQPTTFQFEPGVTCIVGPNGSGKSNVVDALAWVMGEQGAKTLRGGKMEDVIFAGTSTRGPLGRAEVLLTIDNADGALPIDYSEVTISRTLFRNGASEYAINGETVRLLDVQELLSDSGLGREMHVIVGQGRLDSVLQASPEDRRGFIEEAAGILKHRRRKEKTVRKLEAMEANLMRLSDLAGEIRRQLKPLGRQAEVAREAATIAADVRDAKARLYADEVVSLHQALASYSANEQDRNAERAVLASELEVLAGRIASLEQNSQSAAVDAARALVYDLQQASDRFASLHALVGQRLALLDTDLDTEPALATVSQADIDEAKRVAHEVADAITAAELAVEQAAAELARQRAALDVVDEQIAKESAAVSQYDTHINKLKHDVGAAESLRAAQEQNLERQRQARAAAEERRDTAQDAFDAFTELAPPEGSAQAQQADYEASEQRRTEAEKELDSIRERLHEVERESDTLNAQAAALGSALAVGSATERLLARDDVLGVVGDSVDVQAGFEAAIAAALGSYTDAALVATRADAFALATELGSAASDRADIVIADAAPLVTEPLAGATAATSVVTASPGVLALLHGVYVVDDLAAAHNLIHTVADPRVVLVTKGGEVVTATTVRAGSSETSRLELIATRDAALEKAAEFAVVIDALREARADAITRVADAKSSAERTLQSLRENDAQLAQYAQQRNRVTVQLDAADAECERLEATVTQAADAAATATAAATAADEALADAQATERPTLDASRRDGALAAVESARENHVRGRVDLETLRERVRIESSRVTQLETQRDREQAAAVEAARRSVIRRAQRGRAEQVAEKIPPVLTALATSLEQARAELAQAEADRALHDRELIETRGRESEVRSRLALVSDSVHEIELAVHERRVQLRGVLERVLSELSLEEQVLVDEYGPSLPTIDDEGNETAFDRDAQTKRLRIAEGKLQRLGRVNPLALEEFAALESRHAFLTEQLADLQQTRTDLLTIIGELDERMQTIFHAAFEDTQRAFTEVFPLLFPGGSGSISLTDPENILTTGIEVNVRPAGKKIERLSLLSGGERSLAAVALLVAIFMARPSPFYILDEVEAALDDANLGRLLSVFERLRENSQLLVITHQKRTMEIADALYGVSMRQDGVSTVVGQRVRAEVAETARN